ncbi:MAG: thiamine pyrophosphate-binding protein [Myxococcota bacterium]
MTRDDPNINARWGRVIVEELVRSGVRDACLSPGSRNTPLVLELANHAQVRTHSIVDERSAGFFGLGIAKASGRPVVLVCTSGSAGAHYLPAIIEANHSGVPLVALTADRPWELQEAGAGIGIVATGLTQGDVRVGRAVEEEVIAQDDEVALRRGDEGDLAGGHMIAGTGEGALADDGLAGLSAERHESEHHEA